MFQSKHFSFKEWILFLILLLVPLLNIGFVAWMVFQIKPLPLLLKLLIACFIYVALGILAIAFGGFRLT